ncbi:MAG: carboxypeptidase-like regulatory domain-containing protein [Thermoguttaceae bacterium]|jgi:hypothetical protein
MSSKESLCSMFIASVIFATCLLNAGWAADVSPKTNMTDVALNDGGTLQGQVVDLQNIGQPGVPIVLRYQNRDVLKTVTNTNGQFTAQDLHGGVYNIATAQGENTFRLWAPRTAPPAAKQSAIVYVQNGGPGGGGGGLKALLGNPLVLPAVISTAIAVPVAVSSAHHPASP